MADYVRAEGTGGPYAPATRYNPYDVMARLSKVEQDIQNVPSDSQLKAVETIANEAKSLASTAKTTADEAKKTADAAKTTADEAKKTADAANTQAKTNKTDIAKLAERVTTLENAGGETT
ncbi:minor tail protein [Bacillus phage BSTP8]|nr:hypothetical protein BSP19_045 [Bacillus phage BSP19]QQO90141.1 minor tail protein [Bacillus phage BSTP5]QRI44349.1 minor tail protein [Bacillus phage BSTP8]QRI44419.1 minor tail protein [Bacillus phage BSTP10]QRI44467.1 minor tail protein [Bacillus phage BSTP12]